MAKIGVIGAMAIEVELLKSKFTDSSEKQAGGITYFEGKINGVDVVVVQSGVGKVNAALCAQRLILEFGVTHIINTGIAGAMAKGLKVFDLVVSTDAVYHDMDAVGFGYKPTEIPQMKCSDFLADPDMIDKVKKAFKSLEIAKGHNLVEGRIATGDQFISDRNVKNRIAEICSPACVEMEGTAIAHACYINNVSFVIIRCMSDMADDNSESTYSFNEKEAAELSGNVTLKVIEQYS